MLNHISSALKLRRVILVGTWYQRLVSNFIARFKWLIQNTFHWNL
jgi:hypothetical protein